MSAKFTIFLTVPFVIVAIAFYFFFIQSKDEKVYASLEDHLVMVLDRQNKKSAHTLKRSWGESTLYNPINAIEGSKDEYISFYAYQTAYLLGKSPDQNYCQAIEQAVKKDSFSIEQEGLIFTGIERVYRAHKSMELCASKLQLEPLFKKHITYLLDHSYINEGYFISEEFKMHKDKPEYKEVKVQQTYMMLYLASVSGLVHEVDKAKIKSWLDSLDIKEFPMMESVINIYEILGLESNIKIDIKEISNLVNQPNYQFNELMAINSLTILHKKQYHLLDNATNSKIINTLQGQHFGLADIQSEYLRISILNHLKTEISVDERETLLKDFSTYMYEDGMMPSMSSYNNPFSPTLIGRISEEYVSEKIGSHDKAIIERMKETDINQLIKQDPFEVYSYVSLLMLVNEEMDKQQKEKLTTMLLQKVKQPVGRANLMSWNFYTQALMNLDVKISSKMLPTNTEKILDQIIETQSSFFGKNDEISSLVFLDTLANTKLFDEKITKAKSFINGVEIDINSDIAAYLIYYKTTLREKMGFAYDQNETAKNIKLLFKQSGYALSANKNFPDLYSTYFMMNINHTLTEDYKNE